MFRRRIVLVAMLACFSILSVLSANSSVASAAVLHPSKGVTCPWC